MILNKSQLFHKVMDSDWWKLCNIHMIQIFDSNPVDI